MVVKNNNKNDNFTVRDVHDSICTVKIYFIPKFFPRKLIYILSAFKKKKLTNNIPKCTTTHNGFLTAR